MSSLQNFKLTAASAGQLSHDALKALYGVNEDTVLYWAHHEKLCIVDGRIAFMGGIDLCFGRWDTNQHSIADVHPGDINRVVFPGQDYNNARIMDFQDVTHWQNNKLDRTQEPRMGWTDLSISLTGPVVDDLREHFVQRWNFIYYEKYDVRKDVRYKPLAWIAPPGIPQSSYPHPRQSQLGQQPPSNQPLPSQTQPIPGYGGTQQSTSFPAPPTQVGQASYQGATPGAPSGVSTQSGQLYSTPPGQASQTSYQGATPGAVPSQSGQLYPTPPGQTQGGYEPASGQTGAGAPTSGQGTGYTQGNDQYYPPPPSGGPPTGQPQQSYGSAPPMQGTQPYNTTPGTQSSQPYGSVQQTQGTQSYGTTPGAQSSQSYGSPAPPQGPQQYQTPGNQGSQPYGSPAPGQSTQPYSTAPGTQGNPAYGAAPPQNNPNYFPPPPGQATRGLDEEGYGEEGEQGFDDQFDGSERAFSGRRGGRPGSGRLRDELRQRLDSGMQQLDSRYGSKIQSGLQRLDNRFGTHVGSQYAGVQEQITGPRGVGVSCQIVRSCTRWSNGVALEHSIANAYIDIIRRSQHFIYIENQFFITATTDKQKPVQNKIAAAIVERVLRAARQGQKYKIVVVIPAIPGFAGDLRSDDALSTRAIMEFQYNSISRGGYSIYQSLAREGVNPVDYIRFYNLRNYDRINASLAMREAEARSGVTYGAAQSQFDATYGGGFAGDASRAIDPQGAGAETSRGLGDTSGGYEQSRAFGANQEIYGAAAASAQGKGQAPGPNDSTWSLYAPPTTSQPPASGQSQSYAPYHPPQTSTSGLVSPPPPNPDGSYSAYHPPTSTITGPVSPSTPATAGSFTAAHNFGSQPSQPPPSGYDSQSASYGRPQTPGQQQSAQPIAELSATSSPQSQRIASDLEGGVQQTAAGYVPAAPYGQGAPAQQPSTQKPPSQAQGYDQQQTQTQGYSQQPPSTQPTDYGQTPAQTTQTGYNQRPSTQPQGYEQSTPLAQAQAYEQQQQASQQTGYSQQQPTQETSYGGQQPTQQAGYGGQQSAQQAGYGSQPPAAPPTTGYGTAQYQPGDPYQQYQAGSQQIGDHQGLGTSGRWDTVAECYMLNGEDIRKVPWEQGGIPEIDAFVTEELYIHSKVSLKFHPF